jgi:hypothetical protein
MFSRSARGDTLVVWTGRLYSVGKEEGEGGSRTGGGHRRGKKRTHKSYYEMTEKERFVQIRKCLSWPGLARGRMPPSIQC